jgi:hypothetical protein
MAFDQNKYKAIFEARYGSGSFESGLSQARQIGASKVQADLAMSALKKQRTAATKKTYDDALNYWNDPANKEHLLGRGVHNIENDYLNDPREKARVKELGFSQQDYIDAMHSASTNGAARSKREKKQQDKKRDFNVSDEKQSLIPMLTNKTEKSSTKSEKKVTVPTPSKKEAPSKKKTGANLWDDIKNDFVMMGQKINPFDDVSWKEAQKIRDGKESTKFQNELKRGTQRALDSASLGIVSNLEKKETGKAQDYTKTREFGEGGGTDMLTSGLGYLVPGVGGYKALNATKAGKALTQFGSKGIGQRLATEGAKGAIIGAGMSGVEVGAREGLNPNDYNWKQNLGYIGMNTALGAVADPLLYGAGKGIAKGFESASSRTMQNLLPSSGQVEEALKGAAKSNQADNALPIKNRNLYNDLIPKGNEITNPSYTPNLAPSPKAQAEVPRIGNATDQQINLTQGQIDEWKPILDEFDQAVEQQYQYLKNSMGKGVEYGSTGGGGLGNFKEVNGGFRISNNPKWYQDFYKQNGRKPNNSELRQLAEEHVREGFQDEVGTLPAWQPKKVQEIDNEIDEIMSMLSEDPSQAEMLEPILKALEEDKAGILNDLETAFTELPSLNKQLKTLGSPSKPAQSLVPELNVNRTIQESAQPLVPNVNRNITEQPVTLPEQPVSGPRNEPKPNERRFFNTVQNPDKLSPELQQRLNDFDKTYKPMSNEETVKFANEYVKNDMEKAYQFVKNAGKYDPRHITVGHRLIDELQKAGDYDKALDVVERLAEQGTKAGQSIQSFSIYNRLSAEGQLLRAQRRISKVNETITDPNKQVKLTPEMMENISHTADSIQRFTGQMEQANDVMKIMDNIKKGNQPTDAELDTVRSFVSDAKKFVGDLDPKAEPPKVKPVKDSRTRDKVVDFMDKREALAREELKKIFGRANSLPVDALYHLATIGASKIAKGTVKFTDFSEEMAKEFGEQVRPYAQQIYNKAVETFNLQSESVTRQRLSEVEKITNKALKDKNLSADEVESIKEFAQRVGRMSGDAKLESSMELQTILQTLERPTFGQKLSTAQTIAQLLNPKTVVRNALGNEMFYRVEQINKLLATPIDIARSKITGGERTITFISNNQGQYWQNWLTGAKAGWKGVNPMGLTTAYDLGPQAFRSKWNPLTYLEKSLGATLRSFDHAGYMRAYNKTIGELATLRATNEGLNGPAKKEAIARYIREADENMIQIADQYGKYATFQDNTMLSTALTKVKKGMNKVSTLGATEDFGLGDLVLKYPKTPGNLIMRALEYSPAGVVRSAHLLKSMAKTKNPAEIRDFWLSLTRAITGTGGFSLLGYVLADKGILTPAGSSDYELASLEKNAGKQPNSVNISALGRFVTSGFNLDKAGIEEGDTFVSYDWAQPISMAVSLGTGVSQSVKENGELNVGGATKGAFDSATNTIINSSVLKGVNDFLANYPGRTMSDRIGDAAKGAVGSFVPTLSNQFRQIGDNAARTTYSPNLIPEIKNRAINRIPGLEKSLPPAYDTLGNERQTYQNDGNSLFNVFLNPSFVSKYNPSPEAKFALNAINATGDKNLAPRMAQKKLDGESLTSKEYAEYQRIMGEEAKKGLTQILHYEGRDSEEISKAIEKVLREAGKTAREAIRSQRGE